MDIDKLDCQILMALTDNGRVRWSALAEQLGVSAPAIADRVRRLESSGAIAGYTAQLNAQFFGIELTAFITVTLEHPRYRQEFINYVQANDSIQSCHHIVGEGDYLLKVRCRQTADLEQLLSEEIKALPGISQTRTTISLSTVKDRVTLPIEQPVELSTEQNG